MYTSWQAAWYGWSRSLPMRDRYFGWRGWAGLAEILLVQGLAIPSLIAALLASGSRLRLPLGIAVVATRIGVLFGTRRAYLRCHWSYWLSPALDLPVSIRLLVSACRRSYVWRGRELVRGE